MTITLIIKGFKLKMFLKLVRIVGFFSLKSAQKLLDWMFINLDKFYTIEMQKGGVRYGREENSISVRSEEVNNNFEIYDEDGNLVTQISVFDDGSFWIGTDGMHNVAVNELEEDNLENDMEDYLDSFE